MIEAKGKLAQIAKNFNGSGQLLILTHNNPDPDSIAAAFGLRHALSHVTKVKTKLGYGGSIGRAENRIMVKLLRIPLHPMTGGMVSRFKHVAVVDAQPGAKNVAVSKGLKCDIVIDHHVPIKTMQCNYKDLRVHYGSTSTIITEYIKENDIPLNARVATALFYGIRTDIDDLGRGSSDQDFKMMHFLFPSVSLKWLRRIENAAIPRDYIRHFSDGISNANIYKDLIISDLGAVTSQEAVAELSDFLLKIEGIRWSLILGSVDNRLYFSIRTLKKRLAAGRLAVRLAGKKGSAGGHDRSAGGFIPIDGLSDEQVLGLKKDMTAKFLKILGRDKTQASRLAP